MTDRDQKLKARQQEQAELGRVLKTIEETLARQAREAEEARKRELAERQRQEDELKRSPAAAKSLSGPWFRAPAASAAPSPVLGASCPGRSMAVSLRDLELLAAKTHELSGTAC